MSELAAAALRAGFELMVRRDLAGIHVRGHLPPGPVVWAANHHSWWDPFLAAALLRRARRRGCLLMRQDNLGQFRFLRRLGVFDTGQHRLGMHLLRQGRVLVIYPESRLRPAGAPGPLAPGAAWYARRAPAALCPVAVRTVLRGNQLPEAYVSIAQIATDAPVERLTQRLHARLAAELADLDELTAGTEPRTPLPGFTRVVPGRRSWDERVTTLGRWLSWRS